MFIYQVLMYCSILQYVTTLKSLLSPPITDNFKLNCPVGHFVQPEILYIRWLQNYDYAKNHLFTYDQQKDKIVDCSYFSGCSSQVVLVNISLCGLVKSSCEFHLDKIQSESKFQEFVHHSGHNTSDCLNSYHQTCVQYYTVTYQCVSRTIQYDKIEITEQHDKIQNTGHHDKIQIAEQHGKIQNTGHHDKIQNTGHDKRQNKGQHNKGQNTKQHDKRQNTEPHNLQEYGVPDFWIWWMPFIMPFFFTIPFYTLLRSFQYCKRQYELRYAEAAQRSIFVRRLQQLSHYNYIDFRIHFQYLNSLVKDCYFEIFASLPVSEQLAMVRSSAQNQALLHNERPKFEPIDIVYELHTLANFHRYTVLPLSPTAYQLQVFSQAILASTYIHQTIRLLDEFYVHSQIFDLGLFSYLTDNTLSPNRWQIPSIKDFVDLIGDINIPEAHELTARWLQQPELELLCELYKERNFKFLHIEIQIMMFNYLNIQINHPNQRFTPSNLQDIIKQIESFNVFLWHQVNMNNANVLYCERISSRHTFYHGILGYLYLEEYNEHNGTHRLIPLGRQRYHNVTVVMVEEQ